VDGLEEEEGGEPSGLIAAALKAETNKYVERFVDERSEERKRLVVRNRRGRERKLTTGSGTVSTGDFRPALEQLLGEDAAGLSPSTSSRLCKDWEAEHERFRTPSLRFTATRTCSSTASASLPGWARSTGCACWS
jgi:hypothetical protein